MEIDDRVIKKLEELSMLYLDDSEKAELKSDLTNTIKMFDKLSELDTTSIAAMTNVHKHKQELREDSVGSMITKKEVITISKSANSDYFLVPKVVKKK